jgi:hypothetical protein
VAAFYAAIALLPDLDLVFGTHSARSHSVGAAVAAGAIGALASGPPRLVLGLAAGGAYGSHVFLDWLGDDGTPPLGVMALWPFSNAYYQADTHLFMAISRQPWWEHFWIHNLTAMGRELVIVGPIALAAWWRRSRRVAGQVC